MTPRDFQQLSPSIQHEFTLHACTPLHGFMFDKEVCVDLYYSNNGDFFVEYYFLKRGNQMIQIDAFYYQDPQFGKFLEDIDISELTGILRN